MPTQTEITQRCHHRAVRLFWGYLTGATTISLLGNVAYSVLGISHALSSRSVWPLWSAGSDR